jgi:WD40 repeat protein
VKCFPANRLAVGVGTNGTVHLWDLATQMHLRLVPLGGTGFEPAYLSSDSQWLLGYRPDDSGVLCDLRVGQTVPHFPRLRYYSYPAAFSPDGRRLAYSATNYTIKLWDLAARRDTITLGRHDLPVTVLCFSPDGRVLASGGVDGEFKLWSVDTGRLLFPTPKTHQSIVHQLAFSSDGETVVSCDTDLTTHWWNMTTGQEMLLLRENAMAGGNEYLAMESYYGAHTDLNPGAKWLVWQGRRGLIRVTPLPTLAEIDAIDRSQRAAP